MQIHTQNQRSNELIEYLIFDAYYFLTFSFIHKPKIKKKNVGDQTFTKGLGIAAMLYLNYVISLHESYWLLITYSYRN